MARLLWKLITLGARLRCGLPLRGFGVGPLATDLFVSHVSVHRAAARWAAGGRVVEVGCLDGAGLAVLAAKATAAAVYGYEADRRLVRSGQRRFGLDLRQTDPDDLPFGEPAADLLLAINVLQRLEDPDRTLDWMAAHRSATGRVVISVPPVVDEGTMAQHRGIPSHRTHRFAWEWELRMRERFAQTTIYRHLPPAGADLRFGAPEPSRWTPGDFRFEQIAPAQLDAPGSLGVIFVGEG